MNLNRILDNNISESETYTYTVPVNATTTAQNTTPNQKVPLDQNDINQLRSMKLNDAEKNKIFISQTIQIIVPNSFMIQAMNFHTPTGEDLELFKKINPQEWGKKTMDDFVGFWKSTTKNQKTIKDAYGNKGREFNFIIEADVAGINIKANEDKVFSLPFLLSFIQKNNPIQIVASCMSDVAYGAYEMIDFYKAIKSGRTDYNNKSSDFMFKYWSNGVILPIKGFEVQNMTNIPQILSEFVLWFICQRIIFPIAGNVDTIKEKLGTQIPEFLKPLTTDIIESIKKIEDIKLETEKDVIIKSEPQKKEVKQEPGVLDKNTIISALTGNNKDKVMSSIKTILQQNDENKINGDELIQAIKKSIGG